MSKSDKSQTNSYFKFIESIPIPRLIMAALFSLLVLLYPGQNYYQTLIIKPGEIRSYSLPEKPSVLYPVSDGVSEPAVSARSAVIQDVESKTMLLSKNPDATLLPASTTKVMTALVALERYRLDDVLTIRNEDHAVGSTMELIKDEQITVENLLYGLLVESGNDAALALADNYCAAPLSSGESGLCGYDAFIEAMNSKARALHLDHTVYKNVSGVESYGHVTTARDLAVLAAEAVKNPVIEKIVQVKNIVVTDVTGKIQHPLVSTNQLLGKIAGVKGLKTGWTENAGENLISYIDRDGHRLIVVVLNSQDRFGDSASLIEWAYTHHTWTQIDY